MAGLKDVIERISAGGQAAKESLASGGTKEQAREAARQAGKQPSPFLQAAQTLAQSAQETARQPVQAMAPGMQQTASGETEEAEKSSMTKDREEKKEQKNEQQPIVPVYWYEPGANEAGLLTGMSGFQGDSDLAYGQDLRGGDDLRYGSDLSDSTMQKVGDNLRSAINAATRTTNVPHQTSGISDEEYQDELDKFANRWGFDNYAEYEKERGQGTRESDFAKGYLNSLANRAENSPFSPTINSVDENGELVQTKLFEGLPDRIRNYEPPNNIAEQTPKNPSLAEDEGMPAIPASQMAEFYNWSLGTEEGNAFMAAHPEFYDTDLGYATVEDYVNGTGSGYGRLLGTNDRDIWSALLGLDGSAGIDRWRDRYGAAGVDLNAEDATDQLMDYLFGANAINVRNLDDPRLMYGNLSDDPMANANMWRYLYDMYEFGPRGNALAAKGWNSYDWDANDLAYMMTIANMQANNGAGISKDDLETIWGNAGEGLKAGFLDDDEGYNERSNVKRQYTLDDLLNADFDPWVEGNAPVYDQYMIDAAVSAYNKANPDKKIGVK